MVPRIEEKGKIQGHEQNVCVCVWGCTSARMFACAHQWLGGMGGIPCSLLRRHEDFGGGEVAGRLNVKLRNGDTLNFTKHKHFICRLTISVFVVALFHSYVKPVFL